MVGDDYQLWLHHFGLGAGQCASEAHRPKLCVRRDIADLVTSSGICPLAPLPMSLFLTVFFRLDGFLKVCLCTRGFLKMSILEWHVHRFPLKLNILQHCWTLFWWCKLGHYVLKGLFGPPIHACPSVWICSDRRFTGSGVCPSFLLSPAESLSWLSAVLSQKEPKWEVTGALLRAVDLDLGPRETPEGPSTSSPKSYSKFQVWLHFSGKWVHSLIICSKSSMTLWSLRHLALRQNSNGFSRILCLCNHPCLSFISVVNRE